MDDFTNGNNRNIMKIMDFEHWIECDTKNIFRIEFRNQIIKLSLRRCFTKFKRILCFVKAYLFRDFNRYLF